jgi:hypothetical protein
MHNKSLTIATAFSLLALGCAGGTQQPGMSFFITSTGSGKGANLGGLAGADRHCQSLAAAASAGDRSWRAYLSTGTTGSTPAVHARDRIGSGPWYNAKGLVIAKDVAELHGQNNLTKETALTEKGTIVNGSGDKPNMHDILTGSQANGMAVADDPAKSTCSNWTSSGAGAAIVGHHDRQGLRDDERSRSWNASHPSRGCSLDELRQSGGEGLFYCFATR